MKQKEYEMNEDYQKALDNLMKAIKERDDLLDYVNSRPFPPDVRNKKLGLIAQLTKQIDKFEQTLANEYATTQKLRRAEEERDALYEQLEKDMELILEDMKIKDPELYAKIIAEMDKEKN